MKKLTEQCIEWIKSYFEATNQTKAVIGISGGKDSTVVAGLCVAALGKENVFGVLMPNGTQNDIDDSWAVVKHLGIESIVINMEDAFKSITRQISNGSDVSYDTKTNLPARLRMSTLYAVAQNIGAMVANTCNLSEDMVGYATLFGDNAGSFAPVSHLTTEEVMEIGDDLGLPKELVHKTPVDGLQSKTDEDKLGFTYHEVNVLIREGEHGPNYDKIIKMYRANKFKLDIVQIPYFNSGRPNYITGENIRLDCNLI